MSEECSVLQDEEREALLSIYDGDEAFKQVSPTVYQYKVNNFWNFNLYLSISWNRILTVPICNFILR